jgi:FecR protein
VTSTTVFHRGDRLNTGVDSKVGVTFPDGSKMNIGEMSVVQIADILVQGSRENVSVSLKLGEISNQVNPKKEYQTDFKVETHTSAGAPRGTKFAVFYDPGSQATVTSVTLHSVLVDPTARGLKNVKVTQGKEVEVTRTAVSKVAPIGKANAHGGIDRPKAYQLTMAFLDRYAHACALTAPHPMFTIKPAGSAAWSVTIAVQGKATGASTFRVAAHRVAPVNAVAKQIAGGC